MQVKDGDFVVMVNWRPEVVQAIRVTEKVVYYNDGFYKRERRLRLDDVVFAGPELLAKRLATQLTSSRAQYDEDQRKAAQRKNERDKLFIAKAVEATSSDLGRV